MEVDRARSRGREEEGPSGGDDGALDEYTYEEISEGLPELSLFFFTKQNPIRRTAIIIVHTVLFDRIILATILTNCVFLAIATKEPGFEDTSLGKVLAVGEYVFTSIFVAEMSLKVTAMGFVMKPGSYLRDGWNVIDFVVVIMGVVAFFDFQNFSGIRTVRVLRPLRTISGIEGLRVIVATLFKSLPMLTNVLILCTFMLFIFGIIGVEFFAGKMKKRCYAPTLTASGLSWLVPEDQIDTLCVGPNWPNVEERGEGRFCPFGMWCFKYGNPNYGITSFDNILFSWLTIFQCITLEGWTDVMYDLQDGYGGSSTIYFVVLIIFGSFFAVNLALAVLAVYFTDSHSDIDDEHRKAEMAGTIQTEQEKKEELQNWIEERSTKHWIITECYKLQAKPWFDALTMSLIVLNTLIMSIEHHEMADKVKQSSEIMNIILTVYFFLEMSIKITGLGWRGYSSDRMNCFDFVVVICSVIEVIVANVIDEDAAAGLSVLRSFRLLRVFKLARTWVQLKKIINTIFASMASIAYLSLILLLMIFIFALLGMQFFGYEFSFCDYVDGATNICPEGELNCPSHRNCYVPCLPAQNATWIDVEGSKYNGKALCLSYPPPISPKSLILPPNYLARVGPSDVARHNFDDIYWSIVTIFQILTGENWNSVMYDAMRSTGDIAAFYFLFLVLVGNYIILNLFLAILLDNFASEDKNIKAKKKALEPEGDECETEVPEEDAGKKDWTEVIKAMHERRSFSMSAMREKQNSKSPNSRSGSPTYEPKTTFKMSAIKAFDKMSAGGQQTPKNENKIVTEAGEDSDKLNVPLADMGNTTQRQQPGTTATEKVWKDSDKEANAGNDSGEEKGVNSNSNDAPADGNESQSPSLQRRVSNQDDTTTLKESYKLSNLRAKEAELIEKKTLEGISLGLFSETNAFRVKLADIVNHKAFEVVVILVIAARSILLAIDEPRIDPDSQKKKVITILDWIFVYLFLLEAIMKIIVFGFVLTPKGYLRNRWNMLDFLIVIIGLVSINTEADAASGLRALRTLRALRPIRVASRAKKMKVVVNALFKAIPSCGNVALVCGLFYLIFGILGVNLFKGLFYYCEGCVCSGRDFTTCDMSTCHKLDQDFIMVQGLKMTKGWCQLDGGWHQITTARMAGYAGVDITPDTMGVESMPPYWLMTRWINTETNFDNIGHALLALFEMATLEMWLDVMYDGIDATNVDEQPLNNFNRYRAMFFILFIVVGSFFVLNLFVGVTIDKFNEMKEEEGSSIFMTKEQENWKRIQKLLMRFKPAETSKPPPNPRLAALHGIVTSDIFDAFIIALIFLNTMFLAMAHAEMSDKWVLMLEIANYIFTSLFTIEAALKIFALTPGNYFPDKWHAFDFSLVVVSWVGIIVNLSTSAEKPAVTLLRVFRIARIFRLVPKAKGLRTLLQTLTFSLPALINVGSVMTLFLWIYAVMGMNLFGLIRHGEHVNRYANFDNFPNALLLLFRMATGESWNGIMHDCMNTSECIKVTKVGSPFFGQYFSSGAPELWGLADDDKENGCSPSPLVAIFFFVTFVILCAFVMLNLVIAVILDNFADSNNEDAMPVSRGHFEKFTQVWGEVDPNGTCYTSASKLHYILNNLDPPLGVRGSTADKASLHGIILCIDIPEHDGKIHFLETLHALAGRVAGTDLPEYEMRRFRENVVEKLPSLKDEFVPRFTAGHFNADLYVQAAVRGFLTRQKLRDSYSTSFIEKEDDKAGGNQK